MTTTPPHTEKRARDSLPVKITSSSRATILEAIALPQHCEQEAGARKPRKIRAALFFDGIDSGNGVGDGKYGIWRDA